MSNTPSSDGNVIVGAVVVVRVINWHETDTTLGTVMFEDEVLISSQHQHLSWPSCNKSAFCTEAPFAATITHSFGVHETQLETST